MSGGFFDLVNERVFAVWEDSVDGIQSLGSLSPINKNDPGLTFKVGFDGQQILLRFSINVSFRTSGRDERRELFLVLPVKAFCTQNSPPLRVDDLRTTDIGAIAPKVHDAGLSNAGHVLRTQFSLSAPGHVLMPVTKAPRLRPSTSTSRKILLAFQSLSQTSEFSLFMKPSDYARVGLRTVSQHLSNAESLVDFQLDLAEMYNGRGAVLMDWDRCDLGPSINASAPPQYGQQSPPPPATPGSFPPSIFDKSFVTPGGLEKFPSPPPYPYSIRHEILVPESPPLVAGSSLCKPNSPAPHIPEKRRCASPERPGPIKYPRQSSPATAAADRTCTTAELMAAFSAWLAKALVINETLYNHSQLQPHFGALGRHGRSGDAASFYTTLARLAAAFFYNPHDSLSAAQLDDPAARAFVADMQAFELWVLGAGPVEHVNVFEDLLEMGGAARDAVSKGAARPGVLPDEQAVPAAKDALARYHRTKASCVAFLMIYARTDDGEEE
ncbi:hypothetical protein IWX90DRAFT_82123 [Phyllosticta citrichinensis]|uniref:Uncharacterized protein n=1 Tax=Phyllosticta citrichinensis TaxID=1130410 RepID=A0ABR1XG26_9PEZI